VGGKIGNKNAEKWTEKKALKLGNDLIDWLNLPPKINDDGNLISVNIFMIEFLTKNGFSKELTSDLANKFDSFSDLLKRAKEIQEAKIVKYSIMNKINTTMSIFCLKNNHGWKDTKQLEVKQEELSPKEKLLEEIRAQAELQGLTIERFCEKEGLNLKSLNE